MKKLKISFFIILFIVLIIIPEFRVLASDEEDSYVSTVFNERNGLPTGEANDVLQTSDGYIWIGSYGGLIRYDGTNFRNLSTEGKLASSSIRMMFEDSKGRLWIGTNDAGIFVYQNDSITKPEGQPNDSFLCARGFAEDKNGVIYACSNSGIAKITDGVMEIYDIPELVGLTIYSIAVDSYGRLWCADSNGSSKVISDGKVVRIFTGAELFGKAGSIYSITSGKNGEIYVGSSGTDIARITFSSESLNDGSYNVDYYSAGSVSTHNSLRIMENEALLISGQHGFAVRYSDGTMYEFYEEDGADSVNSAYIDYEGSIWLASSSKGIVRLTKGCFTSPNSIARLEGISINTITACNGMTYIGTDSGIVVCDREWNRVDNALTGFYSGKKMRIRDMITDSKGLIWIAAYDIPVVCYNPQTDTVRAYTSDDGIISNRGRVLMELSDGRIALGTQGGLSIISENGVDKSYKDFAYPAILSLLETSDGTILAGSDGGGIYEIKDDKIVNHSFSDGLSEGVVLRMLWDKDRQEYFISAGSSLYVWKDGTFRKLSSIKKEPGSIFDFYVSDDTLWMLQNNGVLASNIPDMLDGGTGNPITYSFAHGLTGSLNANTWNYMADGKLYVSTRNGISIFNFNTSENILPKGIINSVVIDGEVCDISGGLKIPSNAQRITIDFAALSFTDTTPISIAYQLVGFDEEEIIISDLKSASVSYTNLPGGKYTFKMRIFINGGGIAENVVELDIKKVKKINEQPLFWIIVVIISIAFVVLAVMFITEERIKRVRKKQHEYRNILEQSLLTFAGTIDAKDAYTNGHSTRVAQYSRELAKRMGFSAEEQENIYYIALLHDIGKIGIPDDILKKPGKLLPEEWKVIQTHPDIGADILKNFTALNGIAEGAKYHHERYDGKGYTQGLKGEDIPLVARIICVADSFDAMSSTRCYRKSLSNDTIISEFEKGAGTQFDPQIVPHILDMIKEGIVPL